MHNQKRGKLIALTGGEGAGKTAARKAIQEYFGEDGLVYSREPGGTEMAERIRDVILSEDFDESISPLTELLLIYAARNQHMQNKILPALASGHHVILDRFEADTWAYQLFEPCLVSEMNGYFEHLNDWVIKGTLPDYYIYFDIPPEIGLARKEYAAREDINRFEGKSLESHTRVREGLKKYLQMNYRGRHTIIDARQAKLTVRQQVLSTVNEILNK